MSWAESLDSLVLGATPPSACSPPQPPTLVVHRLQPNPPRTDPPLTLSWNQKRESVTAEKVGAHTPQSGRKAGAGAGWRGRRAGWRGPGGCCLRPRHAVRCSLPPPLPAPRRSPGPSPPCPRPAGHQVRPGWTAPALISRLPSLYCGPAVRRSANCPRRCLQSAPTCPKVFPNLEREREGGGWGGRRYTGSESEFPLESLKSVHVLRKNGTNLRSQPLGHVPPLRSLLCSPAVSSQLWLPGPPAPALPLVEALLEALSDQGNLGRINRADPGFIILAPRRQEVSAKLEVPATTACLRPPGDTSAGDPGALRHKESACLSGRHAQLCGYADFVAACSNFVPSNMPM